MRIASGVTDQYLYFVAVDSTDLKTRETGLSSFTVYRSRNGGTATAYTTPTVAELSSSNMPGVYSLLLDEDMTIDSGDVEQEVCLHITQASMAPVTRVFTLFRPPVSAGETLTVTSGRANADVTHIATAAVSTSTAQLGVNVVNFGGSAGTFSSGRPEVNASHISGDSTAADKLEQWLDAFVTGTSDSGTTTTMVDAALTEATTDHYKGDLLIFTSGANSGHARLITAFTAGTDTVTFAPALPDAVTTETYLIVPCGAVDVGMFGGSTGTFSSGRPEVNATHIAGSSVSTSSAQIGVNVVNAGGTAWGSGAITAGSIAADAITAAKIADGAIDAATFAAGAITASAIAADAITDAKVAADVTIASVTGSVGSVTGNVGGNVTGSVGSLAAQAKADVNAEVVDALNTDTYAEPGQGNPGATITLAAKIGYLYKAWRNKSTQTSSEYALYADDTTTKDQEAVVSDDGTTFTRGEISTGA